MIHDCREGKCLGQDHFCAVCGAEVHPSSGIWDHRKRVARGSVSPHSPEVVSGNQVWGMLEQQGGEEWKAS